MIVLPEVPSPSPGRGLPERLAFGVGVPLSVGAEVRLGPNGPSVAVLYTIVPWIGVMAAGYAFGAIMMRDAGDATPALPADRPVRDRAVRASAPVFRSSISPRLTTRRRRCSGS